MKHSAFTAVFDACVLYPALLRDFLMCLALSGRFRARWSAQINDEWTRNLLINRPDLSREQLNYTIACMNKAIPDGLVSGYEDLVESIKLPDLDDRHVLAAAIQCNANVIVTFNLRDFPDCELEKYGIEAQHPDDFVEYLFDLDASAVVTVAVKLRSRKKNPPVAVDEFLDRLEKQGLVQTVKLLSGFKTIL